MEYTTDKEFFELLDAVVKEQTITVPNSDGNNYTFQTLTANQLKCLVQTLVDRSLNNLSFNSTLYQIIEQNLIKTPQLKTPNEFNTLDVTLFLLTARAQTISEKIYMLDDDNKTMEVNLTEIVNKLLNYVEFTGADNLNSTVIESNNIKAFVGIPFAKTELEINNEIYKDLNLTDETQTSKVQDFVGEAFIAEITKWIKKLDIDNKVLDYSALPFKNKVKILESLPAPLVEKILDYIEKTKKDIQGCITISNKLLPLNGSLFSVR